MAQPQQLFGLGAAGHGQGVGVLEGLDSVGFRLRRGLRGYLRFLMGLPVPSFGENSGLRKQDFRQKVKTKKNKNDQESADFVALSCLQAP